MTDRPVPFPMPPLPEAATSARSISRPTPHCSSPPHRARPGTVHQVSPYPPSGLLITWRFLNLCLAAPPTTNYGYIIARAETYVPRRYLIFVRGCPPDVPPSSNLDPASSSLRTTTTTTKQPTTAFLLEEPARQARLLQLFPLCSNESRNASTPLLFFQSCMLCPSSPSWFASASAPAAAHCTCGRSSRYEALRSDGHR